MTPSCLLLLLVSVASAADWKAHFEPNPITVKMDQKHLVNLTLERIPAELLTTDSKTEMLLLSSAPDRAFVDAMEGFQVIEVSRDGSWRGDFEIVGAFLGSSEVFVRLQKPNSPETQEQADERLSVIVIRSRRFIDEAYSLSVTIFISILYVNFGAALDLTLVKGFLLRPVGPVIGFVGQFLLMPLLSYGVGFLLFPDDPELALGFFLVGISPGGGASNMWTLLLGGNVHLSIAMTTISTFAMFAMMPLWLFSLGGTIFDRAGSDVPYDFASIATFALTLIVPLTVGVLIQFCLPRVAKFLVRILKPASIAFIFIFALGIIPNLYIFKLLSWRIFLAGLALPWTGFLLAFIMAKVFRQSHENCVAISIETGIQSTPVAIFMVKSALTQPTADLTLIVPAIEALLTPLPLLFVYCYQRIRTRCSGEKDLAET